MPFKSTANTLVKCGVFLSSLSSCFCFLPPEFYRVLPSYLGCTSWASLCRTLLVSLFTEFTEFELVSVRCCRVGGHCVLLLAKWLRGFFTRANFDRVSTGFYFPFVRNDSSGFHTLRRSCVWFLWHYFIFVFLPSFDLVVGGSYCSMTGSDDAPVTRERRSVAPLVRLAKRAT